MKTIHVFIINADLTLLDTVHTYKDLLAASVQLALMRRVVITCALLVQLQQLLVSGYLS